MSCESALYTAGTPGIVYPYGGYRFESKGFLNSETMTIITDLVTSLTGSTTKPDSLVANRYLTGKGSVPFKSVAEEILMGNMCPIGIISLSLGASENPTGR